MNSDEKLLALWAKADRNGTSTAYHPLVCHLIDVATVAERMWDDVLTPWARQHIASELGISEDVARAWVSFWAGTHDIGKACPAFQGRNAVAVERLTHAGLLVLKLDDPGHGTVSALVLRHMLTEVYGHSGDIARTVATAVGGHHGVLPRPAKVRDADGACGRASWEQVRIDMLAQLAQALGMGNVPAPQTMSSAAALWVAGLVSTADWIGSNEDFFPWAIREGDTWRTVDLRAHRHKAHHSAAEALTRLGWYGSQTPSIQSFAHLFNFAPNPTQREVMQRGEAMTTPGLVIIEVPMGEGKTEAALWLANHWASVAGQAGCYVALPTQATSNQMFGRVRDYLERSYPDERVNLQLLHGFASLSSLFQQLQEDGNKPFVPSAIYGDRAPDGASASVVAEQWFTAKKRALLAPFGVGTVDQALLSVLQIRHVFVRLFGLAHKTVIIDEVHAYDTYMSTLLEQLLGWLASLGTSVVLLSATLPSKKRDDLLHAYCRGLSVEPRTTTAATYPRVTSVDSTGEMLATQVETSPWSSKVLAVRWLENHASKPGTRLELGEQLRAALADGGCAAVICNTVRRAQEVYTTLRAYFPGVADDGLLELDLLHARFLFHERDEREKRALVRFGKEGAVVEMPDGETRRVRRPDRAVLVATQIIEQSLDLDFDLMVTDLAPVDLVLQRSGRLHRHARADRPSELAKPEIWIVGPQTAQEVIHQFAPGSRAVYDGHTLLRSWLALKDLSQIDVPANVEDLVESVYDDRNCPDDMPSALAQHWRQTREEGVKEMQSDMYQADIRRIGPPGSKEELSGLVSDPREEDAPELHPAHQALTRLSEPTVSVVCLRHRGEVVVLSELEPTPIDLQRTPLLGQAKDLLRHSVSISSRYVVHDLIKQDPPQSWSRSALVRNHRCLCFDQDGRVTVGKSIIELDPELGLIITPVKGE